MSSLETSRLIQILFWRSLSIKARLRTRNYVIRILTFLFCLRHWAQSLPLIFIRCLPKLHVIIIKLLLRNIRFPKFDATPDVHFHRCVYVAHTRGSRICTNAYICRFWVIAWCNFTLLFWKRLRQNQRLPLHRPTLFILILLLCFLSLKWLFCSFRIFYVL